MVIIAVSGEITRPLIKKYQFFIVFMEVEKNTYQYSYF